MAYFPRMAENLPEEGAAVVISFATMANEVDKFRSRAILLVARRADIKYLNISMGEVALAFSSRIHIPSYEARVTRHRPEHFMALFDYPPQRDMAVQAGILRVRGIHFDILPWTETQHGRDITWWYRVRVTIEYATFRQDATDIFFCWAWMWNPDFLHRTKRLTIFPTGQGSPPIWVACCSRTGRWPLLLGGNLTTTSST